MTNDHKTLVTIATYNEIDNLPALVDEIFRHAPQVDLLVIDDNSPDGTGDWCQQRADEDPRVHCLRRAGKLGLGTATVAGMKYALQHGYRHMLNMDADFSHHPRYLPALLEGVESPEQPAVDVMIGSRYVEGGRIEGWGPLRHLMSRGVNWYSRVLLGLPARDCSGAFRCYRTARLAELDFDAVVSHGYSFQEEILWRLKRLGCRFAETPITFVNREAGQSKINAAEAWAALRVILRLGLQNLARPKPPSASEPPS